MFKVNQSITPKTSFLPIDSEAEMGGKRHQIKVNESLRIQSIIRKNDLELLKFYGVGGRYDSGFFEE